MGTRPSWGVRSHKSWPVWNVGLRKVAPAGALLGAKYQSVDQPELFLWQGMGRKENPGMEQWETQRGEQAGWQRKTGGGNPWAGY